jgi:uncharacterized protein YecE (DUF72 family)
MVEQLRIGCAGWTIPKLHAGAFATSGSHLARYGRSFSAVEINSSFHRPHRRATYERWAATVPPGFAFAVKAPRAITHELRLGGADAALDAFLTQACGLGEKLGPLLFQLPPSLAFEAKAARAFFASLRARFVGDVVCEPRHSDWFAAPADDLLREFRVGRVAADPPVASAAADPGGYKGLQYYRLHGSPRIYYSQYGPVELDRFARQLIRAREEHRCAWCIFDNTASGAAIANAIALRERVQALSSSRAVRLT